MHHGELVLLSDQDRTRWRRDEIAEAVRLLTPVAAAGTSTSYVLQALIAAQHAVAPSSDDTDWAQVVSFYERARGDHREPAYDRALACCDNEAERRHLLRKRAARP